jgi:hypothetical protein
MQKGDVRHRGRDTVKERDPRYSIVALVCNLVGRMTAAQDQSGLAAERQSQALIPVVCYLISRAKQHPTDSHAIPEWRLVLQCLKNTYRSNIAWCAFLALPPRSVKS